MKLDYNKIKEIAVGAATIDEFNGKYIFSRFTDEQKKLYINRDENCYLRSLSTAGIKLSFKTDSCNLYFCAYVSPGSSRKFYSIDVFVNNERAGSLDNFSNIEIPEKYDEIKPDLGRVSGNFELGEGEKNITIYFPWEVNTILEELSLDDGAFVTAIKRSKTLLAFGDSITQGYDALHSSETYVSRLARAIDADETNKGIGGEMFFPELALTKENFIPDYITVSYGSNDWSYLTEGEYRKNCGEFFCNLRKTYPDSKIFALTPIWRTDYLEKTKLGDFFVLGSIIKETTKNLNIKVIDGLDLVFHDKSFFADFFCHPNESGFEQLYKNLYEAMMKEGDF